MVSYTSTLRGPGLAAALLVALSCSSQAFATAPTVGVKPPVVELGVDAGGLVDGKTAWSSASLHGKIHVLFYVDPDEKSANEELEAALQAASFPRDKFASVAVINLDASWLPNAAISSALASKQEKFPTVTYVKDMKKALVKKWGLKDDAYVVTVFDKQGKLLWVKDGRLAKDDIKALLDLVRSHLDDSAG